MKRLATTEDPVFPLVDFVARAHAKVLVMEGKRYRNTAFRQALQNSGAGVPDASLREIVSYLMAHMESAEMIAPVAVKTG